MVKRELTLKGISAIETILSGGDFAQLIPCELSENSDVCPGILICRVSRNDLRREGEYKVGPHTAHIIENALSQRKWVQIEPIRLFMCSEYTYAAKVYVLEKTDAGKLRKKINKGA